MLLRSVGFGLLISILIGSPIQSVSAGAVIAGVQTQGKSASGNAVANEEYIAVYNNGDEPIDVTDWCLYYGSSTDATQTKLLCLISPSVDVKFKLPAHSFMTFSSNEFAIAHAGFVPSETFSAGISATAGHIHLQDSSKIEVDKIGWGSAAHPETAAAPAHEVGKILERLMVSEEPLIFQDTGNNLADIHSVVLGILPADGLVEEIIAPDVCANIEGMQANVPNGYLLDENDLCAQDVCLNLEGLQKTLPNDYIFEDVAKCVEEPLENSTVLITELLPNAKSYDAGNEFIELYNPNSKRLNIGGYKLQVGPGFSKSFSVPDQLLEPFAYASFSDILTGLVLPNSSGSLRLVAPAGNVVSQTDEYSAPLEDESWGLIDDVWQYTNRLTPGSANLERLLLPVDESDAQSFSIAPCPAGKYRNPDTGRCKKAAEDDTELKTCEIGQERNPQTNRCRSVAASSTGLVACKEGQERNPETNRCRGAQTTAATLKPCDLGEERNPETNRCKKSSSAAGVQSLAAVKDLPSSPVLSKPKYWLAAFAVTGAFGYAAFEWRRELLAQLVRIKFFKS